MSEGLKLSFLDFIPPKFHLGLSVIVGFIGFFAVIALSSLSVKPIPHEARETENNSISGTPVKESNSVVKNVDTPTLQDVGTPKKSVTLQGVGTPKKGQTPQKPSTRSGALGTVVTPAGRRSARIASKVTKGQ